MAYQTLHLSHTCPSQRN